MNRKGLLDTKIMTILIFGVIIAVFMLFFFLWGISAPVAVELFGEFSTGLITTSGNETASNVSNAVSTAVTPVNRIVQQLEWISYFIIICIFIGFIMVAFFVRSYPFLAWIWLVIVIILVFLAIWLSIGYQDIRNGSDLTQVYNDWETNNYLLENFPQVIGFMGIAGGIILFYLATRDPESEAQGI